MYYTYRIMVKIKQYFGFVDTLSVMTVDMARITGQPVSHDRPIGPGFQDTLYLPEGTSCSGNLWSVGFPSNGMYLNILRINKSMN